MVRRLVVGMTLVVVGCGSEAASEPEGEAPCLPPARQMGEACLPPGVQDDGCPAGSWRGEGVGCRPAGVPPELCVKGFSHDGDVGCEVDGDTLHVDGAYAGGESTGSSSQPFTTISDAVAVAGDGALVAIAAGTYVEDLALQKRISLWGVCPQLVTVMGTGGEASVLSLFDGSSGSEIRGLAISGTNPAGILVSGAEAVVLEHLWLHDLGGPAIWGADDYGPASVVVRHSLVESTQRMGVVLSGVEATVEGLEVRDVAPDAISSSFGRGINAQVGTTTPANVTIVGSRIERSHDVGIFVGASSAHLEGVVVRDSTAPHGRTRGRGDCVRAEPRRRRHLRRARPRRARGRQPPVRDGRAGLGHHGRGRGHSRYAASTQRGPRGSRDRRRRGG